MGLKFRPPIDVALHDVTVDGASGGSAIVAVTPTSGGPAVKIVADGVTASHNAGYGLRAVGGTSSPSREWPCIPIT